LTLDEMFIETATYVDETIEKTDGVYTGESLAIVNKFKSAINRAYIKIAKFRFKLDHSEDVVLDANKQFSLSSLSKTFYEIIKIENEDEAPVRRAFVPGNKVECPDYNEGDTLTVYYYYIPAKLQNLDDTPEFPAGAVDHKVLCYYAAFEYLHMEGMYDRTKAEQADKWLAFWNDGYNEIKQNRGEIEQVQDVLGWWR